MNDPPGTPFARHPDGETLTYPVGQFVFTPSLTRVALYAHPRSQPWTGAFASDWTLVGASDGTGELWGVWLADADPGDPHAPAARRLRLWTANPLLHTAGLVGPAYALLLGAIPEGASPARGFLTAYPDYFDPRVAKPEERCLAFGDVVPFDADGKGEDGKGGAGDAAGRPVVRWSHGSLRFAATGELSVGPPPGRAGLVRAVRRLLEALASIARARLTGRPVVRVPGPSCLRASGRLEIEFPEPVVRVRIVFCVPPAPAVRRARDSIEARRARPARHPADGRRPSRRPSGPCVEPVASRFRQSSREWIVSADTVAFTCVELAGRYEIEEICYLTEAEVARAERARDDVQVNGLVLGRLADDPELLVPGTYYRLLVESWVAADVRDAPGGDNPLLDAAVAFYQQVLAGVPEQSAFVQEAFFQTEGPPNALARYVKSSSPAAAADRVFREDDFAVRFLRPYVRRLYAAPGHELEVSIRSADGREVVVPGDGGDLPAYEVAWSKASTASLLPEEEAWLTHLGSAGPDAESILRDDVLDARRRPGVVLEARTRYELAVTGGEGGTLLFEERFANPDLQARWESQVTGWTVADDMVSRAATDASLIVAGEPAWTDVDVTIDLRATGAAVAGVVLRHSAAAGDRPLRYLLVAIDRAQRQVVVELVEAGVAAPRLRHTRTFAEAAVPEGADPWPRLRVSAVADRVRAWVFQRPLFDLHVPDLPRQGRIGLFARGATASFRRLRVRDAVLYRVGFTTSRFATFRRLIESYGGTAAALPVRQADGVARAVEDSQAALAAFAVEQRAWERRETDLRDGLATREDVETQRQRVRQRRAAVDEAFRSLARAAGVPVFDPLPERLEIWSLRAESDDGSAPLVGFWLRSPERLDLRIDVPGSGGQTADHVGRTRARLERFADVTGAWQAPGSVTTSHDADAIQALFLRPASSAARTLPEGRYRLTLTYFRDHGDETAGAQRYARAVEKRDGSDAPETVRIEWQA
jgi:hypothetical protein